MNDAIRDVDAQRARWRRYRDTQGLTVAAGQNFGTGGLGRHADDAGLRVLFVPSDPEADAVALNGEVLEWLKEEHPTPYGGRPIRWGTRGRGLSSALLVYNQHREDAGWTRYLALHRHGGIEIGVSGITYTVGQTKVFALKSVVALAWIAADFQNTVINRWQVQAPFEAIVALRDTNGATLGHFADGWLQPGRGLLEFERCIEDHLVLRTEIVGTIDAEAYALAIGDRVEQAFGTTHRRHVARTGQYEGQFDPEVQIP